MADKIRRKKIITVIVRCSNCPHISRDLNTYKMVCGLIPNKALEYSDMIDKIPYWCPLEDAEDGQ